MESTDGRTWSHGYQNDVIPLPNIRKLQAGGLEFHRHYSNVPVCCPSRASFWSGRHAHHIPHLHGDVDVGGAWNNFEGLPAGYSDRIDQVVSREGYNSLVAGKTDWSTGGHSINVRLAAWNMYTDFPYNIPEAGGWREETDDCRTNGSVRAGGGPDGAGSAHAGDWKNVGKTTAFIQQASQTPSVPWFAFIGADIVHPPYNTNAFYYDKIDPSKIDLPTWAPLEELHPCDLQSSMLKGCTPSKNESDFFYSDDRRRNVRRIYYAMIAEWDAMVGAHMDAVRKAGVWNQTVFIVTSDHGDMQMEHQQHYKMVPYDASASVPMVIYDGRPGKQVPGGKVISTTSQLIDIFPTVLEFAQIKEPQWPKGLDGNSLLPLFDQPGAADGFVVSQFHGDNIAMSWFLVVATGITPPGSPSPPQTFKLIVYGTGKEVPSMLFNLDQDPGELANLAAKPDHAAILAYLETKLSSVVDYPKIATEVAQYGQAMMRQWINQTGPSWKDAVHTPGMRWDSSWDFNASGAIAAIEQWLTEPAVVKPCKAAMVWPPVHV